MGQQNVKSIAYCAHTPSRKLAYDRLVGACPDREVIEERGEAIKKRKKVFTLRILQHFRKKLTKYQIHI